MSEQRLGRYHVLGPLGGGGQGDVFRGYDPELHCERAIKVLPDEMVSDPEARARLLREARLATRLRHSHICTVRDIGEDHGRLFVVMDLVEGETLQARLRRGSLADPEVRDIAVQIAEALAYAHINGVVHRDLSSANVMLAADQAVTLLDFGLARPMQPESGTLATVTATGEFAGTPDYIAPEVLQGHKADARADIWALGVLMHEMLCGHRPFSGRGPTETLAAVLMQAPPPLPPRVPRTLAATITRCLEKEPGRRFQSAAEVKAALEAVERRAIPFNMEWTRVARSLAWVGTIIVAAAIVIVATRLVFRRTIVPAVQALAVLPLENLSGDNSQQYLADGMTDELITTLAQLSALRVTARSSVMGYRQRTKPLAEIARDLHVQDLIEGSVMRVGDQIRVNARLISAHRGQPLWAQSYVRPFRDVLSLQNELARTIADQVRIRLTPQEARRLSERRAVDPEVYALSLRGRLALNRLTKEGMLEARRSYEQAIARDSSYAPAWAGLSEAYWQLSTWFESPAKVMPRAIAAARKAIAIDEGCADGHAALGTDLLDYVWDWDGAERELRRAIELDPSHAAAHSELGFLMRYRGHYDEDRAEVETSIRLDPLTPYTVAQQGWPEFFSRRYAEAVRQFERSITVYPDVEAAHSGLGLALEQLHHYPRAIAELERAVRLAPIGELRAGLAHAYASAGQTARARALLDSLEHHVGVEYFGPIYLSLIHSALGERARALDLLEDGYRAHDNWMPFIKVDPRFDPLRTDPRFRALMARMRL